MAQRKHRGSTTAALSFTLTSNSQPHDQANNGHDYHYGIHASALSPTQHFCCFHGMPERRLRYITHDRFILNRVTHNHTLKMTTAIDAANVIA